MSENSKQEPFRRKTFEEYFFEKHSRDEMVSWASKLKRFRYFRAYGGFANDGDSLDLSIRYRDEEEQKSIFKCLGLAYSKKESEGCYWTEALGFKIFVSCRRNILKITISSTSPYEVTEEDIENAMVFEDKIRNFDFTYIDPPEKTENYLCPQYHPDIFSEAQDKGN